MRSRRGQQMRGSAPLLVLLIGLILILYVLFLPPEDREALLSGSSGVSPGNPGYAPPGYGVAPRGEVILQKFIGTIHPLGGAQVEHPIPTTTVYTSINTQEVKFIDSLVVRRSAFSNENQALTFMADPSLGRNYLLTFNVDEAQGPLIITLNGNVIFQRDLTSRSPEPIKLPQEFIQAENTIAFETTTPGWAFWEAHGYRLRNILVSGDLMDFSGATSNQFFTITPDEYERATKGVLEFVPQCDPRQGGRLSVQVNGRLLYGGLPDCGVVMRIDIPKEQLQPGNNALMFIGNIGSYTIERIKAITILEQEQHPTFYFNLPPDMFQQIDMFAGRLLLTLRFSEGNELKRGVIVVNGYKHAFETGGFHYQATIDPNVLIPNANAIQVLPQDSALQIPEMRMELV